MMTIIEIDDIEEMVKGYATVSRLPRHPAPAVMESNLVLVKAKRTVLRNIQTLRNHLEDERASFLNEEKLEDSLQALLDADDQYDIINKLCCNTL